MTPQDNNPASVQATHRPSKSQMIKAHGYIARIRNNWKRRYAEAYTQKMVNGFTIDESIYQCSPMARQAVRWELNEILGF